MALPGSNVSATNGIRTSSTPCPVGRYSTGFVDDCSECETGRYARMIGSDRCSTCPDNKDTNGTVGNSECMCKEGFEAVGDECKCAVGYTLESGRCVLCAAGFYKSGVGNEACRKCNTEEHKEGVLGSITTTVPATSSLDCTCSKSEFRVLEPPEVNATHYIGQCLTCPDGTDCLEPGITVESLPLKQGYWRSNPSSYNIEECYTKRACTHPVRTRTADKFNATNQCTEGHTGPICNVCLKGYAKSVTGECDMCVYESSVPDEMYVPPPPLLFSPLTLLSTGTRSWQSWAWSPPSSWRACAAASTRSGRSARRGWRRETSSVGPRGSLPRRLRSTGSSVLAPR
jgi:hypothetical protein